jgi:pyruvate-formate lyase-activating enzyme
MKIEPLLVVSDGFGCISEIEEYSALGISGGRLVEIPAADWIPLPHGSQLLELPGRLPVGKHNQTGAIEVLEPEKNEQLLAVAAFVAPAYTIYYHAAYERLPDAPLLPLYAYAAVGWHAGQFYVPAVRIDASIRQDPAQFNPDRIAKAAEDVLQKYPGNRLAKHLVENCARRYNCPAALNYLLNRWEMPLPTAQACNADCIGCISLQGESGICSSQERIAFTPTPEEIIEIAGDHLQTAPEPVVSFGQGCEGEPLLNPQLLLDAVQGIRARTKKGTINLNTNASKPEVIAQLRAAGLDSIRVSLNSAREIYYERYFRPRNYHFDDFLTSIRLMKEQGGFVSLNLFVFPGFTDQPTEVEAVENLIANYQVNMIQWRNLNIDPEWYWEKMKLANVDCIGISNMIAKLRQNFPRLRHGYFNPCLNP